MDWLPKDYSLESYISSCLVLLNTWSWLFKERVTDILKAEVLDKPPASNVIPFLINLDITGLRNVPYGFMKDEWPNELRDFIKTCQIFKLSISQVKLPNPNIDASLFWKMKIKKQEEVAQLSAMVVEECKKHEIQHVIDIGSGLGYIDRVLSQVNGLNILGLEKDPEKVKKARTLGGNIKYEQAFLSEETLPEVKTLIKNWLEGSPACLIALHACGDLSVLVGQLFADLEEAKCLIMVPCCYHLSRYRPLSEEVKKCRFVNTNLLRMASDATSERWRHKSEEQLTCHARSVLARALIELYASEESNSVKKKYRHLLRSDAQSDWNKCLKSCLERFSGLDREKVTLAWENNEWRINQIKAFSCLQVCLQGVAEGLVLADTFLFLKTVLGENSKIRLLRLFDVVTSPRSISFVINR